MAEKDNIEVVEKWVEALNAHNSGPLENYRAPGYTFEVADLPSPGGVGEDRAFTQELFQAFSDFHIDMQQVIAQGDFVVFNGTVTGTHDGTLAPPTGEPIPATGKKLAVPVSNTFQLADGKVVRNSIYYDRLGMMAQLGLTPGG